MTRSKLLGVLAALSLLIDTGAARADVAAPTGGSVSITGGSAATGGATSAAGGTSSTATTATTSAGSTGTGAPAPKDDDGCSIASFHHSSGLAFGVLGIALALGLQHARRRKP